MASLDLHKIGPRTVEVVQSFDTDGADERCLVELESDKPAAVRHSIHGRVRSAKFPVPGGVGHIVAHRRIRDEDGVPTDEYVSLNWRTGKTKKADVADFRACQAGTYIDHSVVDHKVDHDEIRDTPKPKPAPATAKARTKKKKATAK